MPSEKRVGGGEKKTLNRTLESGRQPVNTAVRGSTSARGHRVFSPSTSAVTRLHRRAPVSCGSCQWRPSASPLTHCEHHHQSSHFQLQMNCRLTHQLWGCGGRGSGVAGGGSTSLACFPTVEFPL